MGLCDGSDFECGAVGGELWAVWAFARGGGVWGYGEWEGGCGGWEEEWDVARVGVGEVGGVRAGEIWTCHGGLGSKV